MKLAVLRKRGVAPCAINRDSNQLRAEVMKIFENFIVENHLIAADWTPISWVKREHDRLTAEFAQRNPLIRCASQGEIGRFHSWRERCAPALGIHFFVTMFLPRLPVGRGVCFRGRWHEMRQELCRSGDARFYVIATGSRSARPNSKCDTRHRSEPSSLFIRQPSLQFVWVWRAHSLAHAP